MRYLTPKQTHDATFNSRRVSRHQREKREGEKSKREREREKSSSDITELFLSPAPQQKSSI